MSYIVFDTVQTAPDKDTRVNADRYRRKGKIVNFLTSGGKPVFTEDAIRERVSELAARIDADFAGRVPVFVGVLTGSFIFIADLSRAVTIPCEIDFMRVESYGASTVSSGKPVITQPTKLDLAGRPVIVVDEIVDTGLTLRAIVEELSAKGAAEVRVCALVDKKAKRRVDVRVDYSGFEIEDGFLVGYGLDAAEKKRNLPAIWLLEE